MHQHPLEEVTKMTHGVMPPPPPAPPLEIKTTKYDNLIPISKADYEALRGWITKDRKLHYPILINQNGDVLDGHNRLKICKELGIEPRFETTYFDNDLEEERFVRLINVNRRHMNDYQKAEQALALEPIEAELARQRQLAGKKTTETLGSFEPKVKGRVKEIVSKDVNLSPTTYFRAKTIIQKAPEELKEKVRTGKSTINNVYTQVMRLEDRDIPKPKPPEGQYDVILCDPPWTYDIPGRGTPQNHYPVMSDDELLSLHIPAAENAILFLWTTYPKLDVAIDTIRSWGFTYKSSLVWVKDKIGTGFYFRGQHELLLLAVKGAGIGVPAEQDRHSSVLSAPREEHSKKPTEVYEMIERMYPSRARIELFARGKPREGWTTWGLETTTEELDQTCENE
jgi:N6-adenosine-specific RNA methylase IME4